MAVNTDVTASKTVNASDTDFAHLAFTHIDYSVSLTEIP
jgi:hypothetical protein